MRKDSRLSRMLHVLLHMAQRSEPLTSEAIGQMLGTNPAVVRRTMAGLRDAGYVRSEKGHGGGWAIAADLETVSLLDVHRAVGGPRLFMIGAENPNTACAVEKAVNAALDDALLQAETLLIARLGEVSLADLARDFGTHCTPPSQAPQVPSPPR